jgi:hypothetical protein
MGILTILVLETRPIQEYARRHGRSTGHSPVPHASAGSTSRSTQPIRVNYGRKTVSTRTWDKDRASKRIDARIAELPVTEIEIKKFVRETDLTGLPRNVAYRLHGVHLYADILNLADMLQVTHVEGETCHRRTLRFLNLHYRAAHRILQRVDTIFVDFHNQRLHSVVAKPYDSEVDRLHKAIAVAQLIIDVLAQTGDPKRSMWEKRSWSTLPGLDIYRSNWWWSV